MKKRIASGCLPAREAGMNAARLQRRGMTQLEVVMTTAVAVPLAVALYLMATQVYTYLYKITSALVSWPYL